MTRKQKKLLRRILLAAALLLGLSFLPLQGWWRALAYVLPYAVAGYDILYKAVKGIIRGQVLDENFLMALASAGAMALGDYKEAAAVMLFFQLGELFESYAVGRSRRSIAALMDIRPDYANIEENGELNEVDPEEVEPGTVFVVRPGERIPLDGVVLEGSSELNTAALTGESLPRSVSPGDEAISGCINMTGLLRIRSSRPYGESTVARILELVENAASRKSRSEAFISRFARVYTPAVCLAALALALLPPLWRLLVLRSPALWGEWLYRALTFLVISCPCALVISVPLSFFAGIGGESRQGVLVKGANYLETLARLRCVVFDKTGTLTEGVFAVQKVESADGSSKELLEWAALAESHSSHPLAESLRRACSAPLDTGRVSQVRELSGRGVLALVDGVETAAGSARLMEELGVACPAAPVQGATVVHVARAGSYAGYILLGDRVKATAAAAIAELKTLGIGSLVMLSGDAKAPAEQAAAALGIAEVHSELLPQDKVRVVEELLARQSGGKLAFVGDGINDAPVLSRADVGIAMGALGSDAAIEAADVVLMDDDPAKIPQAIRGAKKCMRIVYENIVFAIGIKLVCLLLGALGLANMWMAIFADVGVMVLAVLNAIRAMMVPGKKR